MRLDKEPLDEADGDPSGSGSGALRDQGGRRRDLAAQLRDRAGEERDHDAQQRDRVADADSEAAAVGGVADVGDDKSAQARSTRSSWAAAQAAADRGHAQQDRAAGALDREYAAADRVQASADRTASARDRHHASRDGLTGLYTREAGLWELQRDLTRVSRTDHPLVLAFVDVDHLKTINDARGHAAGDRLLKEVADTLTAALRPYDLIIRYGGDEFICAIQGIDLVAAGPRFARVNSLLAETPSHGSVTVGLAQLNPGETWQSLIARADAHLYAQRRRQDGAPHQ